MRNSVLYSDAKIWKNMITLMLDPLIHEIKEFKEDQRLKQIEKID